MENQTGVKHIVIIGGGFCGMMTAVNLMRLAKTSLKITIVNAGTPFGRGVAYNAYSQTHLLNVETGNMSAFTDDSANFTNWVHAKEEYREFETDLLAKSFMPRNLYGEYLQSIWDAALREKRTDIEINVVADYATDLEIVETRYILSLKGSAIIADCVVLASGNSLPRNPLIENMEYYSGPTYFRNPWTIDSVNKLNQKGDILIIGNGLTMADTVLGLMEQGFKNKIYSLSTHGFGMLPHRHLGISYNGLVKELQTQFELNRLVKLVNKHIKKVRKLGVSAGPVIDSLRPYSQKIWQLFTLEEKKLFLSKFRHLWGVARHRLPVFVYDLIEKLRIEGRLGVYKGKLTDITEMHHTLPQTPKGALNESEVMVTFYNAKKRCNETLTVQRVINCTGPETSIFKSENPLLRKLAEKGIISCDPLELGINANIDTYQILDVHGKAIPALFTLGTNLKGMLWETIAVPELRVQCRDVAKSILFT